jgi:hypothetical protein
MDSQKAITSKYLEFSTEEYPHVLSMQKLLIINDISLTEDDEVRKSKEKWLEEWEASVCAGLKITNLDITEREVGLFLKNIAMHRTALFLLEVHAFVPYFPINERGSGVDKKSAFTDSSRKLWSARLDAFHLQTKMDRKLLEQIRTAYSNAIREIPGTDWKSLARNLTIIAGSAVALGVTGGIAAPWIGGIIGSTFLGLSGAAATSAGLALLGGGALAVGGAGMVGGTVVLVGGGAILGSAIGKAFIPGKESNEDELGQNLSAFDTNFLIVQSAKIETVCRCAVEKNDLDEFVRTVLKDYRTNIKRLDEMIGLGELLKQKFKNLSEDTLKRNRRILECAAKRIREIF